LSHVLPSARRLVPTSPRIRAAVYRFAFQPRQGSAPPSPAVFWSSSVARFTVGLAVSSASSLQFPLTQGSIVRRGQTSLLPVLLASWSLGVRSPSSLCHRHTRTSTAGSGLVLSGISLRSPAIRFGSSHRECCQAKILSLHELSSLNQALPKADYFLDELSASHVRTAADG
jgi:hypothetical protein